MLLRCNLCLLYQHNNASVKTDVLWLRTVQGRDYLVCKYHRGFNEHRSKNGEGTISDVSQEIQRSSEYLLPDSEE